VADLHHRFFGSLLEKIHPDGARARQGLGAHGNVLLKCTVLTQAMFAVAGLISPGWLVSDLVFCSRTLPGVYTIKIALFSAVSDWEGGLAYYSHMSKLVRPDPCLFLKRPRCTS
jgi:hypothetical protein